MNYTENLSLGLPGYGESADVAALNRNSGILDAYVYNSRQMECEPYDSTKTYMSGDLAIHNEVIYECNTDNTTGTWDDSKWDSTTLAEQIAKAKQSGGGQVTKEASGNPIELTDSSNAPMVQCSTTITGSQNLHGYAKPWVGGAGKNKCPYFTSATVDDVVYTVGNDGIITANGTSSGGASLFVNVSLSSGTYILSGAPQGSSQSRMDMLAMRGSTVLARDYDNSTQRQFTLSETTTITIYFRAGAVGIQFDNTQIKPMVRLTGTPDDYEPYSNICPITAYTEGEIEVSSGADVYSTDGLTGYQSNSKVEIISDKAVRCYTTQAGTYMSANQLISPFSLTIGKTYTLECDVTVTSGVGALAIRNSSYNAIVITDNITQSGHYKLTFEMPSNAYFVAFFSTMNTSANGDVTYSHIRLYEGTERTTHTTTYPSAIYRGSEDVVNGTVTAQRTVLEINSSSSLGFDYATNICTLSNSGFAAVTSENISQYICNRLTVHANSQIGTMSYEFTVDGNGALKFKIPNLTSLQDYQSWLVDNPLEIVGVLATPTTSSVTPTNLPIRTLSGYNHIESSTGDMEIEYITEGYQPLVDLIQSGTGHTYSTSEQVVGKWIDGSDLYEQTITGTADYDVTGLNVVEIFGVGQTTSGAVIPFPYNSGDYLMVWIANYSGTNLLKVSSTYTLSALYRTIRYTKSTTTRSLSAPLTSQKAQIEADNTEEVPTEEEKAVNEEENNDER